MSASSLARVRRITRSLISLPTLPTITAKLLELIDNPKSSASLLAKLISQDQVLTARILKLSNSAFYGCPRRVATVQQAIVIMGFDSVKEMGLSLSVFEALHGFPSHPHLQPERFWRHAVAVAVASRFLARQLAPERESEAFVAGLLHDLGKVILGLYFPREFEAALVRPDASGASSWKAEQELLGAHHGEIGAWLAENWKLPPALEHAIRFHHEPQKAPESTPLAALVFLGNALAHSCDKNTPTWDASTLIDSPEWLFIQSCWPDAIEQLENRREAFLAEYRLAFDVFGQFL